MKKYVITTLGAATIMFAPLATPPASASLQIATPSEESTLQAFRHEVWNPCAPRCSVKRCKWIWWKGNYGCR